VIAAEPAAMPAAAPPAAVPPSLRVALRALRPVLGDGLRVGEDTPTLEHLAMRADPPAVAGCLALESGASRRLPVAAAPLIAGFLDGIQRSRLVGHVHGTPVVLATVAAAIRVRHERQLQAWATPLVERRLFVSRRAVGEAAWAAVDASGVPITDLSPPETGSEPADLPEHPHLLRARALDQVALDRERLERQLAAQWCATESRWLWIDGGLAGNLAITAAAPAFGVVKSHATLYGDAAALRMVLALREGERSPAFLVGHRPRRAVASWYLRLRDAAHGDPLFGLVRVEIAPPATLLDPEIATADGREAFTLHVDRLSSAILLERAPISLPDARWDTLTYGVHACERYLQAVIGS
jgi:hypothetical protein